MIKNATGLQAIDKICEYLWASLIASLCLEMTQSSFAYA